MQKEVFGENHQYTIISLYKLAQNCEKANRFVESELFNNQRRKILSNRQKIEIGDGPSKILLFLDPSEIVIAGD
ncbi:MAG: hypothetical protein V7L29_13325 [Nostoc sp.]|uniref:hypothetical protein n=1 Tax=Nostoc sp. TaxID=1180 RepID=UPI002FF997F1